MKKLVLVFGMLAMVFAQGLAQENANRERKNWTPEERAEKMTARMVTELDLNESQQKEIYAINLKRANDMQVHREQMKEKQASYQAEIEKSLNDVQKAKLAERKESRKSAYSKGKRGQGYKYHGKSGQKNGKHYRKHKGEKNKE